MVQVLFSLLGNVNYIEGFPWVAMACGLPIRHGWCPAAPWLGGATGIDLAPVVLPKQQSMTKIALAKCPHFGAHRTQASPLQKARAGSHWSIINRAQSNKLTIVCFVRLTVKQLLCYMAAAVGRAELLITRTSSLRIIEFVLLNQQVLPEHFHN